MFPIVIALVIGLLVGIYFMFIHKSTFGSMKESVVPPISNGTVMIFFAPWCGHCNDAKGEFEKAVAGGGGDIIMVDATDPDNAALVAKYKITGFPTIIKGDGTAYNVTSREADDIIAFKNSK
jgi:thiol-disulfide isomerase/thioredoxin